MTTLAVVEDLDDASNRIYPSNGFYGLQPGEYAFTLATRSGSIASQCPGYTYSWVGSFFVQTNYKTYWVNPSMDPQQQFTFDERLWGNISQNAGMFNYLNTSSDMLHTYNPRACTR